MAYNEIRSIFEYTLLYPVLPDSNEFRLVFGLAALGLIVLGSGVISLRVFSDLGRSGSCGTLLHFFFFARFLISTVFHMPIVGK
ncbi:MAG: hypothetical protein P4M11_04505 [Candidatus Pacebacteria bacterium]|nr:hypothetical protein [Candidatus Paceibacterota bacterium]